jgi:hypothetical protein
MNDIHPIKPEIVPDWTGITIFIVLFSLGLVAILLLVRWWRNRKKVKVDPVIEESMESIQDKALNQLDRMNGLIDNEKWEEWYLGATRVVKEFESARSKNNLMEMTTQEIKTVTGERQLTRILDLLDQGKFAEAGLNREVVLGLDNQLRKFIEGPRS